MKTVAETLGVARSHLHERVRRPATAPRLLLPRTVTRCSCR